MFWTLWSQKVLPPATIAEMAVTTAQIILVRFFSFVIIFTLILPSHRSELFESNILPQFLGVIYLWLAAFHTESAYPCLVTVFKSFCPKSSFFRNFAICTSTVRVWIGVVICQADDSRRFREQTRPEWSSNARNSWYSMAVRWIGWPSFSTMQLVSSMERFL